MLYTWLPYVTLEPLGFRNSRILGSMRNKQVLVMY